MSIQFSIATEIDLPRIITLLSDDELGKSRENPALPLDPKYVQAFREISEDPNNELIIAKESESVVAVVQITYIPNLTLIGSKRAQIEGVRVSPSHRGKGIGRKLFSFVLNRAKERGCKLAQLTMNNSRPDAFHFYEAIGFKATHVGFKLPI